MDIISIIIIGALAWLLGICLIVIFVVAAGRIADDCECNTSDYDEFNDCKEGCCE